MYLVGGVLVFAMIYQDNPRKIEYVCVPTWPIAVPIVWLIMWVYEQYRAICRKQALKRRDNINKGK